MTDNPVPEQVRALVALLPEELGLLRTPSGKTKGGCIESARLLTTVLPRLGVPCKAVACDLDAMNARFVEWWRAGETGDMPDGAWAVGVRCDMDADQPSEFSEPYRKKGFGGHLVVHGDNWFADLAAVQFDRPQWGIHVPGPLAGPVAGVKGTEATLPQGGLIRWHWRFDRKNWRTTPAWRQDVPRDLITELVARVQQTLTATSKLQTPYSVCGESNPNQNPKGP